MALPDFTMRQLLEAGAHFGHQSHRWNPKMAPLHLRHAQFIHIIDLVADDAAAASGAEDVPKWSPRAAACCSSAPSVRRPTPVADRGQALRPVLRQPPLARRHADQLADDLRLDRAAAQAGERAGRRRQGPHQEGAAELTREREKLETALGGIKDMGGMPDLMFVIDTNKEAMAIKEANRSISRWWRSSTPTAIRTASPTRSRPTTTPAARCSSIATSWRAPPSTEQYVFFGGPLVQYVLLSVSVSARKKLGSLALETSARRISQECGRGTHECVRHGANRIALP